MNRSIVTLMLAGLIASGCSSSPPSDEAVATGSEDLVGGRAGAVYTLSNDATSNAVLVYRRAPDGTLQLAATYGTTGKGSGDGLGSQGALTLSDDHRWLFAVNAGSNELSTFFVFGETLYLVDVVATGGVRPVSVTAHDGIVYVLHAGDKTTASSIAGFAQRGDGTLEPIANSTQPLSAASVGPAQISFGPGGSTLVVTEKGTNNIDTYDVTGYPGQAGAPSVHASAGKTPFGFAMTRKGQVIVSEAFGGAAGAGAASSYQLGGTAGLATLTASAPDGESAPCWVVLARGDRYAYLSNTASGTISRYEVDADGTLEIDDASREAASTGQGSKPIDMALSRGDRFLYVLDSGTASVSAFRVEADGTLVAAGTTTGLPATAVGLAAQ